MGLPPLANGSVVCDFGHRYGPFCGLLCGPHERADASGTHRGGWVIVNILFIADIIGNQIGQCLVLSSFPLTPINGRHPLSLLNVLAVSHECRGVGTRRVDQMAREVGGSLRGSLSWRMLGRLAQPLVVERDANHFRAVTHGTLLLVSC